MGTGSDREWMVPSEVWKSEICNGLDATMVARTLAERGMLRRARDGFQSVRKINGANKRVYVLTTKTVNFKHANAVLMRVLELHQKAVR